MLNRLIVFLAAVCVWCMPTGAAVNAQADSLKTKIDKEAANEDFIHVYWLQITPGRNFYSVYGHNALRLVCPSKNLDYCTTFEMDMESSHYADILTRNARAGYIMVPTSRFFDSYRKEGRGIKAYELNLGTKEKQKLWKFVDGQMAKGSTWTFDYTEVNCTSMTFYAINSAIEPSRMKFTRMPPVVYGDLTDWMDYVSAKSPWVGLLMRATLRNVDESQVKPENLLNPEMAMSVLPYVTVTDSTGRTVPLVKGKIVELLPTVYTDGPCWFTPAKALATAAGLLAAVIALAIYTRQRKHKSIHLKKVYKK